MGFLGFAAFTTAILGIFGATYYCSHKIQNVTLALIAGLALAAPAAVVGGMIGGQPKAALYFGIYPPLIVAGLGCWAGRRTRHDASAILADPAAYTRYLDLQFAKPDVASLPWLAQDWRALTREQKADLVRFAREHTGAKLVAAHDDPTGLYQAMYESFLQWSENKSTEAKGA